MKENDNYYLDSEGLLYKINDSRDNLVIPKTFVKKVMNDFHTLPFAGHPGQTKTISLIKTRFFWPNMRNDIIKFCTECPSCNQRKTSPHLRKAPLQNFPEILEPFERTGMDIVGPFVTSYTGNKYLLTFQDYFTKYVEAVPLPDQKADTVAKAFVTQIITRHGTPKQLITDQGTNFMSRVMKETCKYLGIEKIHTTPYHPQSNGMIERSHRVFKDILSHYVSKSQQDWDEFIPYVLMAYRMNIHNSTGYSPFFLLHGRDPILPIDEISKPKTIKYDCDQNYVSEMMLRLQDTFNKVKENLQTSAELRAIQYNKNTKIKRFNLGDLVYLHDSSNQVGISKKLTKPWVGPYRVVEIKGEVNYRIRELYGRKELVVHVNRLKACNMPEEQSTEQVVFHEDITDSNI